MNYLLVLRGNGSTLPDIPLGVFHIAPEFRPVTGQELKFKGKLYKVAYTEPPNPTDEQTATIFLEPPNPNHPYKQL